MVQTDGNEYLGSEKISKLMFKFSLPCVLSLLVSALYNIVDQIFIGNSELSTLGNAATGIVFPIFVIAQAFAWCLGDGCAAFININQGKNETKNIGFCVGSGITATIFCGLVLVAVFMPLKTPLLMLLIILAFFPVYMLMNMLTSVIRADGSPAVAMTSMLSGAVVNIILDPIFIFALHWGMKGAAWATVIGQVVSLVVCVIYLFRTKTFKLKAKNLLPRFKVLGQAILLGLSSFITQMTIVIIALVCNIMLVKYGALSQYGVDIPIAVIGIESKVFTVVINIVVGIVLGCQPVIGFNMGAGNYSRVKKLYKSILTATLVIGLAATLLFELFPDFVTGLFGQPTNIPNPDDYWEFARMTFRIFLALVSFTCFIKMTAIFFQALGKPITAVIASVVRDIVFFVPLIIILPRFLGIKGILIAAPAADLAAMIIAVALTAIFFKKLDKAELPEKTEASCS